MTNKKVIILGGTHDHIALIEKFKRRNYYIILIDYFDNPPAKKFSDYFVKESTLNENAILKIARIEKPDLVIATSIDQALLTMAFVSEKMNLPCHLSYKQALELTNKAYMKENFENNNIPTSSFQIIKSKTFDLNSELKFPCVVKPADSNSSKGVVKVNSSEDMEYAVKNAFEISRSKLVIIEKYIEGVEVSADVVIKEGKADVIMISQNIKSEINKENFTITQNYFNKDFYEIHKEKVSIIAEKIAKAYNLINAPLLIQFILSDEKLSVIEFSSRIGGGSKYHLIKKITGFDFLDFFISVILKEKFVVKFNIINNYGLINYVYSNLGYFTSFEITTRLEEENIVEDYYLYKTIGMKINNKICSSDRVMGILFIAHNKNDLFQKAIIADNNIKILNELNEDIMVHSLLQEEVEL